jgi:glycosyltransferase involved in cell wall biosynthesis
VLLLPALSPVSFKPKISFYTTCMGRLHHLKLTLPANLRSALAYGNVEFVLLDYNSPDGLEDWVREELSPHIQSGMVNYYKTTRPQAYDSSKAKNTAARLTTGDIICNLDADNWLGFGFAEHLAQLFDAPRTIVRALAPLGGVFGRLSVFREDFLALGGYDESFRGFGFDDTDFFNRARAAGFVDKIFARKYALCLSHPNAERTANMGLDKVATHRQNKQQSARNIAEGRLVANAGKPWGQEPVVKNFGELVSV